jgi:hypothetical protein
MTFNVTSSTTPSVHTDRPAETGSSSLLGKTFRKVAAVPRRVIDIYMGFSLKYLEQSILAFSVRSGEGFDRDVLCSTILAHVAHARHRLMGMQAAVEQDLFRIQSLLDESRQRSTTGAAAREATPAGDETVDAQTRARRQQEQHLARQRDGDQSAGSPQHVRERG